MCVYRVCSCMYISTNSIQWPIIRGRQKHVVHVRSMRFWSFMKKKCMIQRHTDVNTAAAPLLLLPFFANTQISCREYNLDVMYVQYIIWRHCRLKLVKKFKLIRLKDSSSSSLYSCVRVFVCIQSYQLYGDFSFSSSSFFSITS